MLMFMHRQAYYTPCVAYMLASHTCTFTIDHAEQGRVEPPEPAPVEAADYE
jgi:hypothetical protein